MNEEIIKALLEELFKVDSLHQEYKDNSSNFVVDVEKEGDNVLNIKITQKDKQEFESWVNKFDDDLFSEIWESLSEKYGLKNLNNAYNGSQFKEVVSLFKTEATQIINNKIKKLQDLLKSSLD